MGEILKIWFLVTDEIQSLVSLNTYLLLKVKF